MIIKPRMRCQDADISILQVCLRCRRKWARRYHSGVTGGSRPFPALSRPSISANLVPAWLAEKTEDSRHDLRDRPPALALQAQGSKATCTRSATPAVWTIGCDCMGQSMSRGEKIEIQLSPVGINLVRSKAEINLARSKAAGALTVAHARLQSILVRSWVADQSGRALFTPEYRRSQT